MNLPPCRRRKRRGKRRKGGRRNKQESNLCFPYTQWNMVKLQTLGGQPLKENWIFPQPQPLPGAINWRELYYIILFMVLIVRFDIFLSRRLLCGAVWGGLYGSSRKSSMSFFFILESAVISATAAVASSPFPVSAVTDRGLPHGFWWRHRPQMSSWSPAAARALDLDIFIILCVWAFCMRVCLCTAHGLAWCLQKLVTFCHVVLGTKLDLPQEQQVLWTIEPSLQPPKKAIFACLHYTE